MEYQRSNAALRPLLLAVAALLLGACGAKESPAPKAVGFSELVEAARNRVNETTIADLKRRMDRKDKFVLVDVREDDEWAKGRIPGAVHFSRGVLERDLEKAYPDRGTEVLLYCGSGARSVLSADSLAAMGYTNVSSVGGGWRGWTEAGYPVEK